MTEGQAKVTSSRGRLLQATLNYGLGSYIPQVISFFLVPLYTHYLSPSEMGILELYSTGQALLLILIHFGFSGALQRVYFDTGEGQGFRDLVATIALSTAVTMLVVVGLVYGLAQLYFETLFPHIPLEPYLGYSLWTTIFQIPGTWQKRILQVREKSAFHAKLTIASGLVSILLNLFFVLILGKGVEGIFQATLVSTFLFFIIALINIREDLLGRFQWHLWKEALNYGLPLVPYHGAVWAQQFLNRWVLGAIGTPNLIGELALAAKIVSPLQLIGSAFSFAYGPIYFSWRKNDTESAAYAKILEVNQVVMTLGAFFVISASAFGYLFIRFALNTRYLESAGIVGILASATWMQFIYSSIGNELFYSKRTKWISLIFLSATILNFGFLMTFADFGLLAAAVAQLIGGLTSVIISSLLVKKTFPLAIHAPQAFFCIALALVVSVVHFILNQQTLPTYCHYLIPSITWLIGSTLLIAPPKTLLHIKRFFQLLRARRSAN